jgi:hypothetical protein
LSGKPARLFASQITPNQLSAPKETGFYRRLSGFILHLQYKKGCSQAALST